MNYSRFITINIILEKNSNTLSSVHTVMTNPFFRGFVSMNLNFYRPHKAGVSAQQYKDYQEVRKPSKKPVVYQHQKFTPFLESNALPGAFRLVFVNMWFTPCILWWFCRPIVNHQSHQPSPYYQESGSVEVDEQQPPPSDFSAIYDKLAQLKLRSDFCTISLKQYFLYIFAGNKRCVKRHPTGTDWYRSTGLESGHLKSTILDIITTSNPLKPP